jgi:hypothetical protein
MEDGGYYSKALIRKIAGGLYVGYVWNDLRDKGEDKWGEWIMVGKYETLRKAKEKTNERLALEAL